MVLAPGPNMIHLVSRSIAQGRRADLVSLLGVANGFFDYLVLTYVGLAAVFAAVPTAYAALKWAGVPDLRSSPGLWRFRAAENRLCCRRARRIWMSLVWPQRQRYRLRRSRLPRDHPLSGTAKRPEPSPLRPRTPRPSAVAQGRRAVKRPSRKEPRLVDEEAPPFEQGQVATP